MPKHQAQRGFFDDQIRLQQLSNENDPLVQLDKYIVWENFRSVLDGVFAIEKKGKGGRPPYDYVMMFKMLILQRYYNLSDEQLQFQVLDRLSFMRFLGIEISHRVPDRKTIWYFRNRLTEAGAVEKLFASFGESLEKAGLVANEGKIIDASFVEVPRQRNNREENAMVKNGETPEGWQEYPDKLRQKDLDARWTKKNNQSFFGYKNHIKADGKSKLIDSYVVTDASVHDSQTLGQLIGENDAGQPLWADSAYTGEEIEKHLETHDVTSNIVEKGYRNRPLTAEQNQSNRTKSVVRCRVEHVFGFIEVSMHGSHIKSIGIKRAGAIIGLMNLTYNIFRSLQLLKIGGLAMSI